MIVWTLNLNFTELLMHYGNGTPFTFTVCIWLPLPWDSREISAISVPSICYVISLDRLLMWWLIDLFIFISHIFFYECFYITVF